MMVSSPWTKTVDPIGDWKTALHPVPPIKDRRSFFVNKVHTGSPAAQAGIEPGWQLLRLRKSAGLQGQPMSSSAPKVEHLPGYPYFQWDEIILRAPSGQNYKWGDPRWPFGIVLRPPIDEGLKKQIALRRDDRELTLGFWKSGDLVAFAQLRDAFADAVAPRSKLRNLLQPRMSENVAGIDYGYWGYLALAEAHLGNAEAALEAADRAAEARSILNQASYSGHDLAVEYHARALAMVQLGDMEAARDFAETAHDMRPDVEVTRDLMRLLGDQAYPVEPEKKTLETYPVDYKLPCHDPVRERTSSTPSRSFEEALKATRSGQLLAISVLGDYRSNYYYNEDIARLAMIHRAFPDLISEVHVIVSSDYALDEGHRHWAEDMSDKVGLPFVILFDEEATVAECIGGASSPMRALVGRNGEVLSTANWADETGIWEALQRMAHT